MRVPGLVGARSEVQGGQSASVPGEAGGREGGEETDPPGSTLKDVFERHSGGFIVVQGEDELLLEHGHEREHISS